MYENSMITVFILVIDDQNHIIMLRPTISLCIFNMYISDGEFYSGVELTSWTFQLGFNIIAPYILWSVLHINGSLHHWYMGLIGNACLKRTPWVLKLSSGLPMVNPDGSLKSHFLIDQGSEFMGSSESGNNSLLFINGILKFQHVHKSPPHPALFYQKYIISNIVIFLE